MTCVWATALSLFESASCPSPAGAVHPSTSPGLKGFAWGIVAGLSRSFNAFAEAAIAERN